MKYAYVEGFAGNGFEDAGVEIHEIKLFTDKTEALAYSGEKFVKFATMFLGEDCVENDMGVHEMAEQLNGWVDVNAGHWEVSPESTSFGLIKELV